MFFPKKTRDKRAALTSCHQDLMAHCVKQVVSRATGLLSSACSARFLKESSVNKRELFPDIDHIDVQARPESLRATA